ncbi:MAG: hypothetical protein CVU97_02280 [Firmicutes bacterium HGW-Firmicutes-21]|nr:MAG: hypothetical protein CVU97_02280 [Firmicutes bacterium HGW-Firmicutes-21]
MKYIGKKILVLAICIVLTLSFILGACNTEPSVNGSSEEEHSSIIDAQSSEESDSSEDISDDTSSDISGLRGGYDPTYGKYFVNMPEFKWSDKTEFKVLVYDNTIQKTYYSEEVGTDKPDIIDVFINESVRERNDIVLEKYGVEIKAIYASDVRQELVYDTLAGTGLYDAAMPFFLACTTLAQNGHLYNLADERFNDYIDLNMPWWDQNTTESFSIGNKVYFTTGDISFSQKKTSLAVLFNKNMLAQKFPDVDLYKMVRNGEWTLDEMITLSKAVTKDTDGIAGFTYKDTWGLASSYSDAMMFYLASGERMITKDANDFPNIAIGSERSITVAQNVLEQLQYQNKWVTHCNEYDVTDIWQKSLDIFTENRALFRTSNLIVTKFLRQSNKTDLDFGVLPMPKYNAEQESYYTPCAALMAHAIVIPVGLPDPEFSAFMIEVMACEAKNYITPAYYDYTLKYRDMRDDESAEMLDIIFDNVVYDMDMVYNFGAANIFTTLMNNRSNDFVSMFDYRRDHIIYAIEKMIFDIENLE